MKLKLLTAVATTAMMAVPSIASATDYDDEGWYLRGNVGYGTHNDMDFVENDIGLVGDVESEGNVAYTLGAGYDFGNNWRVELDGSDLWTDLGAVGNISPSYAKLRTTGIFVNALYDFDEFGNWEPYVGAGIGYVRGKLDAEAHGIPVPGTAGAVFQPNAACNGGASFNCNFNDDSAGSLGWQLLAGMGYDITDKLTWDTQYRYQNAGDMDFDGVVSPLWGTVNGAVAGRSTLEDIGAHMLMTGLRYRFGESKPMVTCWDGSEVKMIGQCPAQPVMVSCWDGSSFEEGTGTCPDRPVVRQTITCWDGSSFEEGSGGVCPPERQTFLCWDNSVVYDSQDNCPTQAVISDRGNDLTSLCSNQYRQEIIYYEFDKGQSPETRATVGRILDIGEFCRVDNIRVVGHTDTSGSAAYNLALSQRRAKDARDELVRQGINGSVITSDGKGETEPFVPTGDGVKEQLNRRTEVLITLSEVGVIN